MKADLGARKAVSSNAGLFLEGQTNVENFVKAEITQQAILIASKEAQIGRREAQIDQQPAGLQFDLAQLQAELQVKQNS